MNMLTKYQEKVLRNKIAMFFGISIAILEEMREGEEAQKLIWDFEEFVRGETSILEIGGFIVHRYPNDNEEFCIFINEEKIRNAFEEDENLQQVLASESKKMFALGFGISKEEPLKSST